ncbi:unnamed protein product, partial [Cyprideis torosa]
TLTQFINFFNQHHFLASPTDRGLLVIALRQHHRLNMMSTNPSGGGGYGRSSARRRKSKLSQQRQESVARAVWLQKYGVSKEDYQNSRLTKIWYNISYYCWRTKKFFLEITVGSPPDILDLAWNAATQYLSEIFVLLKLCVVRFPRDNSSAVIMYGMVGGQSSGHHGPKKKRQIQRQNTEADLQPKTLYGRLTQFFKETWTGVKGVKGNTGYPRHKGRLPLSPHESTPS